MVRAWINGTYRSTSWRLIGWGAVLVLYLFSPIDIIPDYIPFFGVIDDLVLLGFFARSLRNEIARFMEWERKSSTEGW